MQIPVRKCFIAVLAATMLFVVSQGLPAQATKPARITGTYTNLTFNREGGDLLGQELRIVLTRNGYQGVLQFSNGEPGEHIVVNINATGNKIEFTVPDSYSEAGHFSGTIDSGTIRGSLASRPDLRNQ